MTFNKFARLVRNLPLIILGIILLAVVRFVPQILYSGICGASHVGDHTAWSIAIFAGLPALGLPSSA